MYNQSYDIWNDSYNIRSTIIQVNQLNGAYFLC